MFNKVIRSAFSCSHSQIRLPVEYSLKVWYLDDTTIGGFPESVFRDVQRSITELKRRGLEISSRKTKIINVGLAAMNFSCVVDSFDILFPELKVTKLTKMEHLGSPILNNLSRGCIMKKLSKYKRMSDHILLLDGHPDIFLLKNALSLPSLLHTLCTVPCHHHPKLLA